MNASRNRNLSAKRRSGVAMVEAALVLNALLLILFGMLDLGLAVLNYNSISEAARRLARQAIVHGEKAPPKMAAWGPSTYDGTAGDGSQYAQIVEPLLVGIDPEDVTLQLEWPDGTNEVDQRVRVTLSYVHAPLLPLVFGSGYPLTAVSTMKIAH